MINGIERINQVKNFIGLIDYLRDVLEWELDGIEDVEDALYEYEAEEFRLDAKHSAKINSIKQIAPMHSNQPWGIFWIDFGEQKPSVVALRGVLRGLVKKKRASANESDRQRFELGDLLFILTSHNFNKFDFAYFRGEDTNRATLAIFGWQQGDTHIRTLCEHNLPALSYPADPTNKESWLKQWRAAFDVEAVTDKFFADYRKVFNDVETEVRKTIKQEEPCRLYTQRLFNRLMFIYFIQKKGWLLFEGDKNYLRALFNAAQNANENFLNDRLYWLFFHGMGNAGQMSNPQHEQFLISKRGIVPYLNGGLFDAEEDETSLSKENILQAGNVEISNQAFAQILDLFERYNFTVTESTPLDVQVAVDPEMLGKVFEELVTGRHESGSYYTPRPIVSFMCREALKYYLAEATHTPVEAVARFVDEEDTGGLKDAEATLEALKRVRVCDPACGSGAYLLGMMQELLRLRGALFKSNQLDDESIYERKRSIIENNLYGVDKDRFAVQIACLRLWLSLAIDSQKPQPLPNLDFKIGCGDSLIAPSPKDTEQQLDLSRGYLIQEVRKLKSEFMRCDAPERKKELRKQIDALKAEIALALKHQPKRPGKEKLDLAKAQIEGLNQQIRKAVAEKNHAKAATLQKQVEVLKRTLKTWESVKDEGEPGFDWAVEFAEVFEPEMREAIRAANENNAGFDIVLANPPYVRMELFKPIKPLLKQNFPDVHAERADLYVYFYDRAHQLLRQGGVGAFISSNKWLRAGYGENLRQHLLDKQAFHLIVDFGDLPVFKATAYPAIFIWQKRERDNVPTTTATVEDLQTCYSEGIREYVIRVAQRISATQFRNGKPRLAVSSDITGMSVRGTRLKEIINVLVGWGVKTGLNDAFIINRQVGEDLIAQDKNCQEVIKPLLKGDDVRRYEIQFHDTYLIYLPHGIDIRLYPVVCDYLRPFRERLENRATRQKWYELQQPQVAYTAFFTRPKIIFPDIAKEIRFAMDSKGYYSSNTTYFIPLEDWFLLGVLNSSAIENYFREISSEIRGGYMRFFGQYMENLPIPDASTTERDVIAKLAKETQDLHTKRRKRVERFLLDLGISPAASSSRNPLEQPWALTETEFMRRLKPNRSQQDRLDKLFNNVRDETYAFTETIIKIEREIDERVAALYGVPLEQ
ncbi:MAG: TaqI-like C-terminal specificity domain-containing protein [Acidobacteriota bacterium]